jgi:hypothetical protein
MPGSLSADDAAQVASLDAVREMLVADARSWAAQIAELTALAARAEAAGTQTRRTLPLELAGSWQVGQLTAERWLGEAERFVDALPRTLAMLGTGQLLRHQATVLLHRTQGCDPDLAQAVEAEVLPDGAGLCPSDLARRVDRVRLRLEAERGVDRHAERVAERRTWTRPVEDGMAVAGALLTAEQATAFALGLDRLERRERLADRAAGATRTAEQRKADLFAALPAMVLAGWAQDDRWRQQAGVDGGRAAATAPCGTQPQLDADAPPPQPWTFTTGQVCAQVVLDVHVPVATVLDRSQAPGELAGHGPVGAGHVRLLRPHGLRRVLVDAATGRPLAADDRVTPVGDDVLDQVHDMLRPDVVTDLDEAQHDPSARLARLVDLRDVRCGGPGCASSRCDRDHLQPWPTGPTSAANLGLLSRRCHSAKHHGWTLTRHPDGSTTWDSPLLRHYDRPGPWDPPPDLDLEPS